MVDSPKRTLLNGFVVSEGDFWQVDVPDWPRFYELWLHPPNYSDSAQNMVLMVWWDRIGSRQGFDAKAIALAMSEVEMPSGGEVTKIKAEDVKQFQQYLEDKVTATGTSSTREFGPQFGWRCIVALSSILKLDDINSTNIFNFSDWPKAVRRGGGRLAGTPPRQLIRRLYKRQSLIDVILQLDAHWGYVDSPRLPTVVYELLACYAWKRLKNEVFQMQKCFFGDAMKGTFKPNQNLKDRKFVERKMKEFEDQERPR